MKTRFLPCAFPFLLISACTVGPDYIEPELPDYQAWNAPLPEELSDEQADLSQWWTLFDDPQLSALIEIALEDNNSTEIAALRVLEARAQLGIAIGSKYPQTQAAFGDATSVETAETTTPADSFEQYNLGATISWEPDFWGRFRRSIEAADAAFLGSVAAYDQAIVLLIAQVVDLYTGIRFTQGQLQIARDNVVLQQRSYDIAETLYNNGESSELDMVQAQTLLLSTESTIPALEAQLSRLINALNVLLGRPPGPIPEITDAEGGLPALPPGLAVGLPGNSLRLRPDVRLAEYQARAQSALVGFAETDLYPSFSLGGNLALSSGSAQVDSDFSDLFSSDALNGSVGVSMVWPFLNYGRIRNNVRVQDARLQQALINYVNTVLRAAREAEDALVSFVGFSRQTDLLEETVAAAQRANNISVLRYQEGLSSYQRVLDSQQALFTQQQRLISSQASEVSSIINLFSALGAGWQRRDGLPTLGTDTIQEMQDRTNWGDLLEPVTDSVPDDADIREQPGAPGE